MMARVWLLTALLFMGKIALSQFNDSTHYYVKYATTGNINRTNDARSYLLANVLNFQVNKQKVSVYSNNAWIYGQLGNTPTNNDFSSVLNADFLKDVQKLYYWGLVSYTSSFSLKINYQFQAGGGIGYNFVNKPKFEIVASDGLLFDASDLQLPSGVKDQYQTVRNSLRVKHRWIIDNLITLEGAHYWQPSLKDISDYIVRSNTSLSIKLRKWLSLTTSLFYNKLSRTDRENLLLNFGITAEKYF